MQLRRNLELTGAQDQTVATRQRSVRDAVATQLTVTDAFLTGSYRRHTLIGPLKRADTSVPAALVELERGLGDLRFEPGDVDHDEPGEARRHLGASEQGAPRGSRPSDQAAQGMEPDGRRAAAIVSPRSARLVRLRHLDVLGRPPQAKRLG